jgi:hypothetical protein
MSETVVDALRRMCMAQSSWHTDSLDFTSHRWITFCTLRLACGDRILQSSNGGCTITLALHAFGTYNPRPVEVTPLQSVLQISRPNVRSFFRSGSSLASRCYLLGS